MIRNRSVVVSMTFLSLGLLGALLSAIGASLPSIQHYFGLDIAQSGRVSTLFQLSYAIFCLLGGFLTDYFGKNKVLTAGGLLYGICMIWVGSSGSFAANLALFAIAGIGGGLLFMGANTLTVQLFPARRGKFLNLLHLCFAIGSVLASLAVGAFLTMGLAWNSVFRLLGAIALANGLLFAFTEIQPAPSGRPAPAAKVLFAQYGPMMKNRLFLSLLAANTLAISAQFGIIYLLVSFLKGARALEHSAASLMLAVFFVFLGAGRIICSKLIGRYSIVKIITILLALLVVFLAAGWLTEGYFSFACFMLTGLACSGLMPSFLALASLALPKNIAGLALGLFSMFGGLGGMALTRFTTWFAGRLDLDRAFLSLVSVALAAFAFFVFKAKSFAAAEKNIS